MVVFETLKCSNYQHSTAGVIDFGSLLVKKEDLHTPATLSSCLGVFSTTSTCLLTEGMQGGFTPSPAKTRADDSPLLRSLSPILPLSQASPGMGQEMSLANVFVPLDAIKQSEFQKKYILATCLCVCVSVCLKKQTKINGVIRH